MVRTKKHVWAKFSNTISQVLTKVWSMNKVYGDPLHLGICTRFSGETSPQETTNTQGTQEPTKIRALRAMTVLKRPSYFLPGPVCPWLFWQYGSSHRIKHPTRIWNILLLLLLILGVKWEPTRTDFNMSSFISSFSSIIFLGVFPTHPARPPPAWITCPWNRGNNARSSVARMSANAPRKTKIQ